MALSILDAVAMTGNTESNSMTRAELIEELKKGPADEQVGFYAYNGGDDVWYEVYCVYREENESRTVLSLTPE